jgi:protein involved in polysaccharide export with SLBB domain
MTTEVSLDLSKIMAKPNSDEDITLHDGDEWQIPRFNNTVSVGGEVLKPVSVQFESGKGLRTYLSAAGGFTRNAYKSRAFVVYPNGRSAKSHSFLGIRSYPRVTPGSSIFVPLKPETIGFDAAKAGILVSALSAVMTGMALLFR